MAGAANRRLNHELRRLAALSQEAKREEGRRVLGCNRKEQRWRTGYLTVPDLWALRKPKVMTIATALELTDELLADIDRTIAEVIDSGVGQHPVGRRPIA